jgi:hypothetical protein
MSLYSLTDYLPPSTFATGLAWSRAPRRAHNPAPLVGQGIWIGRPGYLSR